MNAAAFPVTATGSVVWDRLWRAPHTDAKDDALLLREMRSPRWHLIVRHLRATFGTIKGLHAIELGSGRGDLSALLARRGAAVTLLDSSEFALAQAARRFDRLKLPAQFLQGDFFNLPPEIMGRFDVALSSGVIEHFKGLTRTAAVNAHHVCLRPGGMAVISVPHARCLPYRLWKAYLELRRWWPYGMEIPYGKSELVARAQQAGFTQIYAQCMGFWQSVSDQLCRTLLNRRASGSPAATAPIVEAGQRPALPWLDRVMGMTLLLIAHRSPESSNVKGNN